MTSAAEASGLPYRPCVGIMVLNAASEVFAGLRAGGHEARAASPQQWQMPQGGIDEGEEPYTCALRELYEETNIRSVELLAEYPQWLFYDLPDHLVGKAWKGRYRGQSQKWFAFRFTGDDSEIDVNAPGGGAHRPEFSAWRWLGAEDLTSGIVPFKRPVYEELTRWLDNMPGFGQRA